MSSDRKIIEFPTHTTPDPNPRSPLGGGGQTKVIKLVDVMSEKAAA